MAVGVKTMVGPSTAIVPVRIGSTFKLSALVAAIGWSNVKLTGLPFQLASLAGLLVTKTGGKVAAAWRGGAANTGPGIADQMIEKIRTQ